MTLPLHKQFFERRRVQMESVSSGLRFLSVLVWSAFLFIGVVSGLIIYWAQDTKPPFKMKDFTVDSAAPVGGFVKITMFVDRDISRNCDVVVSRFVQDAKGYRSYSASQSLSAADVVRLELTSPGVARVIVPIPLAAAPGLGTVGTTLQYTCNPVQRLFPIYLALSIPVEIVDKK